jgi:hypothetical protein
MQKLTRKADKIRASRSVAPLVVVLATSAGLLKSQDQGQRTPLNSKGIPFGVLARNADGTWDADGVRNEKPGNPLFFAGNSQFLTRRLQAVGSKPNFFHHGQFTTIREAILNYFGEALATQQRSPLSTRVSRARSSSSSRPCAFSPAQANNTGD